MSLRLRLLVLLAAGILCLATCAASGAAEKTTPPVSSPTVSIPGPLRPFLRMAGISQEVTPDEVLPMLARNVSLWGYETDKPTEFLLLIERYVQLARELQNLAGPGGVIRIAGCDDATRLIHILGYQFEHGCSSGDASLITADAERAFLTIDSGFPLTRLEEDLQKGRPFELPFAATPVPVLFTEHTWTSLSVWNRRYQNTLVDVLLHDRNVDRLYSAMSRMDTQTRQDLQRSPGMRRLLAGAGVLDFYGTWLSIRSGQVAVPGGDSAVPAWKELVGASPQNSGEFVSHLLSKDHGWMAAYYDAVARISPAQQAHLTDPARLKQMYEAFLTASKYSHNTASDGVFPRNVPLLVLLDRVQWQPDGSPQVPGSLDAWKEIVSHKTIGGVRRAVSANTHGWKGPDQLLEALAASSLTEPEIGPLQIYLILSAIDSQRPADRKLSDATVRLMADRFFEFNSWYQLFVEFPALDDTSINRFLEVAGRIDKVSNPTLRTNVLGAFQAEVSLWQILARQGQIPERELNASWQKTIAPYGTVTSNAQLFDAARASLQSMLRASAGDGHLLQNQLIDLLAGPVQASADGRHAHRELARRISAVMDDQRLVSLDTLFGLYDGLDDAAHGKMAADTLLPLASDLREFELPRPIFTGQEKTAWAPIVYTSRHAELQVRTDLTRILSGHSSPDQLEAARSRLAPFLRDTLVGLVYAYYEPPGAQVLHNNPLFVRSHDFSAASVQGIEHVWGPPELIGVGVTAGGGAYLLGSLADLPYALATVEQDFIAPAKVQALIWKQIVPEFLVDAVVPRWWGIRPEEMHAAALYQRAGEELLVAAASDPQLREQVLEILSGHLPPARFEAAAHALEQPSTAKLLIAQSLPSEMFYLAAQFRIRYPGRLSAAGKSAGELASLAQKEPARVDPGRLARLFGVPHLELTQSNTCSLLNGGIYPASGAFDGRLFGESWESTNLYWARLADEMGYSPAMLNVLVPSLTRRMVSNVFATNIDDWPAVLRALEQTGDEFRQGKIAVHGAAVMAGQLNHSTQASASGPAGLTFAETEQAREDLTQ